MASPKFDHDRAAKVVAEAMLSGDATTCKRHGITLRTLQRWKAKVGPDHPELTRAVAERKAAVESIGDWAAKLAPAIAACIDFLKRAAEQASVSDPQVIHSVAGGLKILSDVTASRRVLDRKLGPLKHDAGHSGQAEPVGATHRPGNGSGEAGEPVPLN